MAGFLIGLTNFKICSHELNKFQSSFIWIEWYCVVRVTVCVNCCSSAVCFHELSMLVLSHFSAVKYPVVWVYLSTWLVGAWVVSHVLLPQYCCGRSWMRLLVQTGRASVGRVSYPELGPSGQPLGTRAARPSCPPLCAAWVSDDLPVTLPIRWSLWSVGKSLLSGVSSSRDARLQHMCVATFMR